MEKEKIRDYLLMFIPYVGIMLFTFLYNITEHSLERAIGNAILHTVAGIALGLGYHIFQTK